MKDTDIKLQDIIRARNKCADLIAKYGKAYLPVFERLENEIAVREKQQQLFNRALKISTQNRTHFSTQNGCQEDV